MVKLTTSGLNYIFNFKRWINCWIKCLREPIQKSAVLTDLLVAFLCICFFAIFGYTVLIIRIPSGTVHRPIAHSTFNKRFQNAPVFRRNPIVPMINRHQHLFGWNGHGKKPLGRALLHQSRSFRTHDIYSKFVDKFIESQNVSHLRLFQNLYPKTKPKICQNNESKIDLFILIFSHCEDKQNRDTLRQTWLTYSKQNTVNIRYMFLLGEGSIIQNNKAEMEAEIHRDILIGNFQDTYKNLTLKTIMGLQWVVHNCNQTKFILKTDDDVWVNVPMLLKRLLTFGSTTFTLGGKCQLGRPHRDIKSKYYVSREIYPSDVYPPFCTGTGYVTTPNVASKIFNMSAVVPYFPLEDIYVAMCLTKLNISVNSIPGFHNSRLDYLIPKCYYKTKNVLLMHKFNRTELQEIWTASSNCTNNYQGRLEFFRNLPMGNSSGRNSFKGWRGS